MNPLLPWMKYLLRFAGVFNLLAGLGMICLYHEGFKMLGVEKPALVLPVQIMGILVGLFGVGYLLVAANPVENRNILMLGFWSKAISSVCGLVVRGGRPAPAGLRRGGILRRRDLSAAVFRDSAAALPAGAARNEASRIIRWREGDSLSFADAKIGTVPAASDRLDNVNAAAAAIELHQAVDQGKEGVVAPLAHALAGVKLGADLPHQNMAGADRLAAKPLHAAALAIRITSVTAGTLSFFVCHGNPSFRWPCPVEPQPLEATLHTPPTACWWPPAQR